MEALRQERDKQALELKSLASQIEQLQRAENQLQAECQGLKADKEHLTNSLKQLESAKQRGSIDRDNLESRLQKLTQENQRQQSQIATLELKIGQLEDDKQKLLRDSEKQQSQTTHDSQESQIQQAMIADLKKDKEQDDLLFERIVQRLVDFLKHVCGPSIESKLLEVRELAKSPRARHYLALPLLHFALIQYFNAEMEASRQQIDIVSFSKGSVNTSLEALLDAQAEQTGQEQVKLTSPKDIEQTLMKIPKYVPEKNEQVVRLLFLPYSQGIYIAFLLQNQEKIQT